MLSPMARKTVPLLIAILSLVHLTERPCYGQSLLEKIKKPRFQHFGVHQGLSQNSVTVFLRDRNGFLWVGTEDGLNRFDGYEFKIYEMAQQDPESLSNDSITALYEDSRGNIWIGTRGELHWIDHEDGRLHKLPTSSETLNPYTSFMITSFYEDPDRGLWAASGGDGLILLDLETLSVRQQFKHDPDVPTSLNNSLVRHIHPASHLDGLWVTTDKGLNLINHSTGHIKRFPFLDQGFEDLHGHRHYSITEYPKGTLWIGTGHGLLKYNYENGSYHRYEHDPNDPTTISVSMAYQALPDPMDPDFLWISTVNGLNRLHIPTDTFTVYKKEAGDPFSLADNLVFTIYDDDVGNLWVGTYGDGISLLRHSSRNFDYIPTKTPEEDNLRLTMSVTELSDGSLMMGSLRGGLLQIKNDGTHKVFDQGILPSRTVSCIYEYAPDDIWIGTQEGLIRLDPNAVYDKTILSVKGFEGRWVLHVKKDNKDSDRFWLATSEGLASWHTKSHEIIEVPVDVNDITKAPAAWTSSLTMEPRDPETLWFGTNSHGLSKLDTSTLTVKRFPPVKDASKGPANAFIISTLQDPNDDHVLWIGTYSGLSRMDKDKEYFTHLFKKDGLASDLIYAMQMDQRETLWLSTTNGISNYDPHAGTIKNYDVYDGLQENEFNANATMIDAEGRIYFGGIRGVSSFLPNKIQSNQTPPRPLITQFLLANKDPLLRHQNPNSPLVVPILNTNHLELGPKDNVFSFRFAAPHFANLERNTFAYRLEGFDENWTYSTAHDRLATYTNLPSGDYSFQVKAANRDGLWSKQPRVVTLTILPPPWQTWWAYTLYTAIIIGLLYFFYRVQEREIRSQKAIADTERQVNQRLRQLDALKDEFLANTSHELRTPLNGIIGLADSLAHGATGRLPEDTRTNLNMIAHSARRLSRLVNDILDFSKLKNHNLDLNCRALDIHMITDLVLTISTPLLNKDTQFQNKVPTDLPAVLADEDRLQQILHNLIGNAIKFTDAGTITVGASLENDCIEIYVKDTGIGIPNNKLDTIFESFEQVDGSIERTVGGTGLGLAITRKLVEILGGTIQVTSTVGEGSTFSFTLPISQEKPQSPCETPVANITPPPKQTNTAPEPFVKPLPKLSPDAQFCILVVDDEPVNRQVANNYLRSERCTILQAENGPKALEILNSQKVDLVLLDIMMPRMSGYEVCEKLRDTFSVHELPVIFLTARNQVNDLTRGFNVGANDYIVKPISKGELLSRVSTHLQLVDINRNLEERVKQRTNELSRRNQEIVRAQKHLIMQEKMAFLGTLAAGMAHEIRNPLNIVKNLADVCRELAQELIDAVDGNAIDPSEVKPMAEDLATNTGVMVSHGVRMDRIIHHLMEFARERKTDTQEVDITKFVSTYVQLAAHGHPESEAARDIQFDIQAEPEIGHIKVLPTDLSRAIINLVNNAIDAILLKLENNPNDFQPTITLKVERHKQMISIVIEDNGIGMSSDEQEQALTPFFTTKIDDRHIGLGLPISYDIITQGHGGSIKIDSSIHKGTSISFTLYAET